MPQIGANELKRKDIISVDGQPYLVLEVSFASPSARGASTMVKAKVRNLLNGAVHDKNYKSGEKFDVPDVDSIDVSVLYEDTDALHFMDQASFEQFALPFSKISDIKGYMKEGMLVQALKYNGQIVSIQLPVYVELKVTETEPVRGDAGSGSTLKPAKLETGMQVKVPGYIKEGDLVRVNTQSGEVGGRA